MRAGLSLTEAQGERKACKEWFGPGYPDVLVLRRRHRSHAGPSGELIRLYSTFAKCASWKHTGDTKALRAWW